MRVTCETCPQYLALDHDDLATAGPVRALRAADPLPRRRRAPVGAPRRRHDRLHHHRPLRVHVREPAPRRRRHLRGSERPARHRDVRAGRGHRGPRPRVRLGRHRPLDVDDAGGALAARAAQGRRSRSAPTPTWRWSTRRRTWTIRGADLHHTHKLDAVRGPRGDRPGGADARARDDGLPGRRGGGGSARVGAVHPGPARGTSRRRRHERAHPAREPQHHRLDDRRDGGRRPGGRAAGHADRGGHGRGQRPVHRRLVRRDDRRRGRGQARVRAGGHVRRRDRRLLRRPRALSPPAS